MDKEQVEDIVESLHTAQQDEIINTLKDKDIWFTTKQDPTYMEPSSYYELDEYGQPTEDSLQKVEKDCEEFVGDGAIDFTDAIDMWIEKCLSEGKLAYKDYLVTKFKDKPVVQDIQAYEVKTEGVKTRLKEENTKSLNLISQMFQADDFDANSNEGKIVVKTSELFNKLSDQGYDVQVAFDNGDSQSTILLGQQGGSVNITITDANKPLQAFTSGSFELNDENIKVLQDIVELIQNIK